VEKNQISLSMKNTAEKIQPQPQQQRMAKPKIQPHKAESQHRKPQQRPKKEAFNNPFSGLASLRNQLKNK
jgi:hypothetical protein